MAGVSDDDVPTESPAEDLRRGRDGDAISSREARDAAFEPFSGGDDEDDEEDRTVRSTRLQPQSLRKPELPPPTSRKLTAVGLGAPPPATRPAAGYDPSRSPPEPVTASPDTEADEIDESVTAQAPAPRVSARLPLPIEGSVSIRTLEDDESDETEVRTMPGATEAPALSRTTESARSSAIPTPRMPGAFEASDDDPTHQRAAEYDDDDDEDSVTTRGPALDPLFRDDSVTAARGPVVRAPSSFGTSPGDDGTGGTTHKMQGRSALPRAPIPAAGSPASPADEEKESITTQAPGHLTNMLRVIAAGPTDSDELDTLDTLDTLEDDEPPQNKTAVMPNAPVKPDGRTTRPMENGRAVAAPQLTPSSESGLRVARPGSNSGERASLRALGVAVEPHVAGVVPVPAAEGFAPDGGAMFAPVPLASPPLDVEPESKPRYGLVVATAAVLSFVIPLALFFYLRHGQRSSLEQHPSLEQRPLAEPAADLVQWGDDVRPKANKGTRSAPSSSAASSASASPPKKR